MYSIIDITIFGDKSVGKIHDTEKKASEELVKLTTTDNSLQVIHVPTYSTLKQKTINNNKRK